jgi:hypothetical protein
MATISHRQNTISQILNEDGIWVQDHSGKEDLLWSAFKNRLGFSTQVTMLFNLDTLVTPRDNLEPLGAPIYKEEIDSVVKRLPSDKAPGPDGFNGLFIKKCWNIIKSDFYQLCQDFFEGNTSLEGINNSFIVLIPKKINPEIVNDYRPIYLMNLAPKLVTKILADRLQIEIIRLVHKNQYGFIRSRTIQDCLAWCFEYLHQCHQSIREIIILKLDFKKAFDLVEHQAIIQVMTSLGLPANSIHWVTKILSSASTAVLLNGVPAKFFNCKRGVRQGDPLSPLLFVLAAELLQVIINQAASQNLIEAPIAQPMDDFPIVQYADDTLLFMKADAQHLFFLKSLLNCFAQSTGLRVNYQKSQMLPINVSDEKIQRLALTFGCSVGSFPFTYMGLPMGTTKPRFEDLTPMIDKVERKLSGCTTWLSYCGRLQMMNAAITPITTYAMCTIRLPRGVIDNIDRMEGKF